MGNFILNVSVAVVGNSEIEPMLIHPTKWGYRNNKTKTI